jgi:Leucine-rich repeat (LRR) protein
MDKSYLNSLPDNITKLDVSNRGLTSLDVRRFTNLKELYTGSKKKITLKKVKDYVIQ